MPIKRYVTELPVKSEARKLIPVFSHFRVLDLIFLFC